MFHNFVRYWQWCLIYYLQWSFLGVETTFDEEEYAEYAEENEIILREEYAEE